MKWSIPEKVIERGRTYLNENRVLSVTPDIANQVWHAEVLGSEVYLVDLDGTAKEEDYCQCPYWDEHQYCKHTVAVELYLRKEGKTRFIQADEVAKKEAFSLSEMFSNGFSRVKARTPQKTTEALTVEFQVDVLETNPYHQELSVLGVSLKLGYQATGKTYVVKNIYKFLQSYQENKTLTINKQYVFHLEKEAFTPSVSEVLTQLAQIAQTQQLIGQTGVQVKGKMDKKYLLLPVNVSQGLINAMQVNALVLVVNQAKITQPQFTADDLPLHFTVTKEEEQFVLAIQNKLDLVLTNYHWGIKAATIYQLSQEQLEIYTTLSQLLKRVGTSQISYPKTELSQLFKRVLPLLKRIGTVTIQPEVYQFISDEPLQVEFILRKKQGQIALQLDYHYGLTKLSSDAKYQEIPENHPEVLRDYVKETRAKQLLQQLAFNETTIGWSKPIPKGESLYHFFTKELPVLRQMGSVKIGKRLRELYLDAHRVQPQIQVSESGSWLDVHFDISGIADNEIDAILASLLRQDPFYTLENGQVLALDSQEFQQTSQILQSLREGLSAQNGVIQLPLNQGLQLQEHLKTADATFSDSFNQMVENLTHPERFAVQLPQGLTTTLREYQQTGFKWLKMLSHYQFGGILADEMGLGKTLQAITYLLSEKQEHAASFLNVLIVAPASLTYNWQQEIKKFAPSLSALVISGNKAEREKQLATQSDVYITSYASLRQDVQLYTEKQMRYLILDEAQMVKNSTTKTAQALRSLEIPHRFALSGTPIENHLEELWSLFQMIMPGFFPNKLKFRELSAEEVAKMIQPFVLRRDKATVLADLPEKIETNYYSSLTEEQKKVYLAYLRQMRQEVTEMDSMTFKKNRISILAGLTRLRQICCDPHLFLDDYEGSSGKLEQVKDIIQAAKENNRRILLFSQFTGMLTIIEDELQKLGLSSFYLRGSTPPKERIEMVDSFNAGEKDVFLISLKAGGTGLNLTGADTVILYDLWWNPAVEEQAAGRAHRIGQKNVVEVWRMISEGTIEERMDSLQQEKRELFQKVIQGNEAQLQQMTEADIRSILSIGE